MENSNNGFSDNSYDLGLDSTFGFTKAQVSEDLKRSQFSRGYVCLICGNTAQYKLLPKSPKYNTVDIQDKGYVCGHCLNINSNIDKAKYGIKELR